jgi:hypothetical protein
VNVWWEILIGLGIGAGVLGVSVVCLLAYFGWRLSNRGPL